jgi:hypothetical protein
MAMRSVVLGLLMLFASLPLQARDAVAPKDVTLGGRWVVNAAASDDGEALLAKRMEEIAKEQRRFEERHRRRMDNDPFAWEPEFTPPADTPQFRARMEERDRGIRQTLGMTKFLNIKQGERGTKLEVVSEFDTRRLDSGSRSQVSLPQGQLADLRAGWDRDAFVIERHSRDGPRISERYRWLKKTDQLEVLTQIKGDSMLSGMKLRRVFDRAPEPVARDPALGPVR